MRYNFNEIEAKWQKYWAKNQTFGAENNSSKPKFYVLDMFPYPSGAGLHVGHPLGYIASDIYARYKRHQGFNVLHPMGFDSFGLPAEQYAIQTGQHPALTTEANISRYREQLDKIGFSFDWSREVRTSDPKYYKWTQWIFIQLFNSWYNSDSDRAEDIQTLISIFEKNGNAKINAVCDEDVPQFTDQDWKAMSDKQRQGILLKYRLTYLAESEVNWCPALGTVLANDEIVNGVSERGGHPVIRKKMTQWSMRITAYAQRLLDGLDTIDWPQPLKDSQTNWIGRSEGASVVFKTIPADQNEISHPIEVFTTRPDTIFGASFMTLAPEHELVDKITSQEQMAAVKAYIETSALRSERDRMADVKSITGVFTGAYAAHPFTEAPIPIWIGDYVLAGYGTGAVMSVPCGDQRDYDFAKHFNIPIPNIFQGADITEEAFIDKAQTVIANSDFLNGLAYEQAVKKVIAALENMGQGKGKVNYRLRDAVFSRQRYWGEPFPVYYVEGMPKMVPDEHLPIKLPEVVKYLPTETGEPPLGNATEWAWDTQRSKVVGNEKIDHKTVFPLELNTMPGWAGSSQYFNRYMDPHNESEIFSKEAIGYWQEVDLYIGGSEHATGHLLYSRFWQKFMFDKGLVPHEEFAKKLINQGMVTGMSAFIYQVFYDVRLAHTDSVYDSEEVLHYYSNLLRNYPIFLSKGVRNKLVNIQDSRDFENLKELLEPLFDEIKNKVYARFPNLSLLDIDLDLGTNFAIPVHVDVNLVNTSDELDIIKFKNWRPEYSKGIFVTEELKVLRSSEMLSNDGSVLVGREIEKMSKSKYNVVSPDSICQQYGADSLRLYEMFLGPLEQSKPWNTAGITGVHGFLKKLWRLYFDENGLQVIKTEPSRESLKTLHKTIKKVVEDIEHFSFNTTVSSFMICVNELTAQNCNSRAILEPLVVLVSPYAPHIAEEIWAQLGHNTSISTVPFPVFEPKYLVERSKEYPISFNGKMRFTLELPSDMGKEEIEATVLAHEKTKKQMEGRIPKKVIVVPGKIVNIVG
jgi:leucyl-tRNA synthetase